MSLQCYMLKEKMPAEISFEIFSYLGKKELAISAEVCKDWYERTRLNELWTKFYPGIAFIPKGFEIKQRYCSGVYPVHSGVELRLNFLKFLNKLKMHQIGIFKCIFTHNLKHSLEVKVQFQNETDNSEKVERICCYGGKLSNKNIQIFLEKEEGSLISYHARINRWASKFFISAKCLASKRFLELSKIEKNECTAFRKIQVFSKTEMELMFYVIAFYVSAYFIFPAFNRS